MLSCRSEHDLYNPFVASKQTISKGLENTPRCWIIPGRSLRLSYGGPAGASFVESNREQRLPGLPTGNDERPGFSPNLIGLGKKKSTNSARAETERGWCRWKGGCTGTHAD